MEKSPYLFDKTLILRQIPLFAKLNFFERRLVLDSLEIVEYKRSQIIYRQDDPPNALHCIITGRVEIFIKKDKDEEILEHIHRGKYFGFISLLTGEPHSVSARAVNDTIIAKIPKEDFNSLLKSIPSLAIDLSQMLSRRLKRKDLHIKSIFESTIISIYGDETIEKHSQLYSLNLALGLRQETRKKVILVDIADEGSVICENLDINPASGFPAAKQIFSAKEVLETIQYDKRGIDVLRILSSQKNPLNVPFLISLLTMLVNDYHYCLISLSGAFGAGAFKVLSQSDVIHLVVSSELHSLRKTIQTMESFGIWMDVTLRKKIKPIILEEAGIHGKGLKLSFLQESEVFHQPIFATLPRSKDQETLLVDTNSNDPYSKTIRRISREVGEVLVGLALGSGSAMGMAHIGVLKVLEFEQVPIDIVSGSSIGGLIAALWCCGYSSKQIEEIILENKDKRYLFGIDDLTFPLRGFIKGRHIRRFLKRYLKDKTFFDVNRPLKIVACDCLSMRQVVFDSGRLVDAVMASISIPGVFEPYKIADRYYIDGGILNPLPTDVLVECGAKRVISVNVLPSPDDIERTNEILEKREFDTKLKWPLLKKIVSCSMKRIAKYLKPNIFDVIVLSVQSFEYLLAELNSLSQSDVRLHPDMTAVSWSAFKNAQDLIRRGEEEACLHLSEINQLINQPD